MQKTKKSYLSILKININTKYKNYIKDKQQFLFTKNTNYKT